jgi:hypothetical protein
MGDDVVVRVTFIDPRLEDLDTLAGDLGAAEPPNQLFALAAEHGAANNLDPT